MVNGGISWRPAAAGRGQVGVVDSTTNYVEHPELVAQRIERYARAVGPERVVAATDCGLATVATAQEGVDPRIAWAKLGSLVEGARLAGERLRRPVAGFAFSGGGR